MRQYHDLLQHILDNGTAKTDRTGTGTISVFGYQNRYDLSEGFPLVTTKKLHLKSIIYELLWFLNGDTNTKYLKENGVGIWNEWENENGDLGPVYGKQWRSWEAPNGKTIDQISELIQTIKHNPDSRRMVVSAWNVADLPDMALSPCHCLFQFYVAPPAALAPPKSSSTGGLRDPKGRTSRGKLSCQLYQRSADSFLGVPFNIASYALLTMMIAQVCDLDAGDFIHTFGDLHLYSNHLEQANLQLSRECRPLPKMQINPDIKNIFDFQFADFQLLDYNPHPHIKAAVAV